ncbi:1,4-dihydroxy-2-naphthoate octaprenyltransferase [Candidatus Venteria ishoeyi]|uniref:1,4-dihydroxy-2-naphthoate octaprenyltransferase n=1 Tax=Candidatus Venteria ishoeyi TaxID=1899563 RepID=A0A1H6F926_9GAMM|nr:1,4-dihydroxy-2-naphthoate octaprenyltransferase [Candidatus Venteria ishoeyi]SEH05552.1 1%2C4-dihydroxy-2-naphthoate octaprenyltransferase [Candidatus Venteria ishoeyi]SEH05606.1 1%2C4-dihydroxy-2-naphthoate octaprenyltransferase [Candidatus Venteria ishoeyi]
MIPAWLNYAWLMIRPKTLTLAITPLLVATSIAWSDTGQLKGGVILALALAALLIQIATNIHNDAADFERGTDSAARIGPARAAVQGWFSAHQIKNAARFCFAAFWLPMTYLVWIGGWLFIPMALFTVFVAYSYTGGPRPISNTPFGEVTVFSFFGLIATGSFYYLQTSQLSVDIVWSGAALGFFAAAVLLVNNYRDLETDQDSGRLTLVYYLGRKYSRWLYSALLLLPFSVPALLPVETVIIMLLLPMALYLIRRLFIEPVGPNLNSLLASTGKLQLLYGLLMGIAYIV